MAESLLSRGWIKTNRTSLAVFLAFTLVPLLFAAYSGNIWEDYYITYRSSKNLAMGHGFVFTEGEKIHVFTSPLGTLLPALCSFICGPTHDNAALWLFRFFSSLALGGAGVLMWLALRARFFSITSLAAILGLLLFDAKTIAYTINGMETAFVLFFLSLSWYALLVEDKRMPLLLGIAWGGVMWSRPDGFIYAGATAAAFFFFQAGVASKQSRLWLLQQYGRAALIGAVIYLPWFLWAWNYYGTPVPHTVIAKGLRSQFHVFQSLFQLPLYLFNFITHLNFANYTFSPPYGYMGGWPRAFVLWWNLLWVLAALPIFLPGVSRLTRAACLAYLISDFYVLFVTPFISPWYFPNSTWAGYIGLGLAVADIGKRIPWKRFTPVLLGALLVPQLLTFFSVAHELRVQQVLVEVGVRQRTGEWLKLHAATPHDTVFLECLGYIGFFSNLKMCDFPGLSSAEVVQARTDTGTDDWSVLIDVLRPNWVVLRPSEIYTISRGRRARVLEKYYRQAQVFDASHAVQEASFLGKGYAQNDQTFVVFQRAY